MTNPFEDPDGTYLALMNDEGQHSLWPAVIDVPTGWRVVHPHDTRQACLDYIHQQPHRHHEQSRGATVIPVGARKVALWAGPGMPNLRGCSPS